jgi:hypothetical protein
MTADVANSHGRMALTEGWYSKSLGLGTPLAAHTLTRKRDCPTTLWWHYKIPHTRISRNGMVIDTLSHESD